jgi:hypothetical protein
LQNGSKRVGFRHRDLDASTASELALAPFIVSAIVTVEGENCKSISSQILRLMGFLMDKNL